MSNPDFKPFCAHEPHFDGRCILSLNPDGESWTVETDFSFHMGNGDGFHLTVNKGDQTDGASIPNLGVIGASIMAIAYGCAAAGQWDKGAVFLVLGWLIALAGIRFKPWGKFSKAAVAHDHLYRYSSVPRIICDAYFWIAMRASGVDHITAAVMFLGVRIGGWKSFYEKRRHYAPEAMIRAYSQKHYKQPPEKP